MAQGRVSPFQPGDGLLVLFDTELGRQVVGTARVELLAADVALLLQLFPALQGALGNLSMTERRGELPFGLCQVFQKLAFLARPGGC